MHHLILSIFTREDLDEFGSDIEVNAYDADGSTYFTSITPDMRKIKRIPQDLTAKYGKVIVDDIVGQYEAYHRPF